MSFVHLHNHSEYSLLDGLSKITDMVSRVKELKHPALAITDHGAMYGIVPFYLECKNNDIKPIIGCEVYMAHRSRHDKQARVDADQYHLILLAKNSTGYQNLMKIVTKAHLEGYYYKPRADMELLEKHHEGLIAMSACVEGEIPSLLVQNRDKEARRTAKKLQNLFGNDFYLEIMDHPKIDNQTKANKKLITLSRDLGIPLVASNDNHYVLPEDAEAQDALLAIQTKKTIADKNRLTMLDSPDFYIRSTEEMKNTFGEIPDAIKNTLKIAEKCDLVIPMNKLIYPDFPLPKRKTAENYLRDLIKERIKLRFSKLDQKIRERVEYELKVICDKGYATYFLIVQDFVNWAKAQGIRVGPGRGSVAGSLVSYILRITSINPLLHNIPFERFLNPDRPSPPDIDLDFADERRDEVIEYVTKKYGSDKVAQIITFGTMEARGAIRDIGRVLGFPYSDPDKVAKSIPFGMSINEAIKKSREFQTYYQDDKYRKLIELSRKVEGCARHASTHAAGVVISDKPLTTYCPLQKESKGDRIVTQYDMYALDLNVSEQAIGLMKMDFLGLRNLTILQKTVELVKTEKNITVDLSEVPLDKKEPYQLIMAGHTIGVFQLESAGMRRLAKNLKPSKFSDITAMVALYRPGPMDLIPDFIKNKNKPDRINYIHRDLTPILSESYGILLYQDQVLLIANVMADYTMVEADKLRRAMGKKKAYIMAREKKKFLRGVVDHGYTKSVAEKVWNYVEKFAGYGFNKAHSVSYATIAYQTAYMKAFYPVEFMCALLTADSMGASGPIKNEKITRAVSECKRMKINVLPPDINKSATWFTIEKDPHSLNQQAIRFGLAAIKNVGEAAIGEILKARSSGKFKSLSHFCNQVDGQKVNKKVLESLIQVGAMDRFGNRASQLTAMDKIRSRSTQVQQQRKSGQTSLFDTASGSSNSHSIMDEHDVLPAIDEFSHLDLLNLEKNLLGLYLTEHPMAKKMSRLAELTNLKLYEINRYDHDNKMVSVGGMITSVRKTVTRKSNSEMAFATISDDTGSIDLIFFPRSFEKARELLVNDQVIVVTGKVEFSETRMNILVEETADFDEQGNILGSIGQSDPVIINIPKDTSKDKLITLNNLLKSNPGSQEVVVVIENGTDMPKRIRLSYKIDYNSKLREAVNNLLS